MRRKATGHYATSVAGSETVQAFVPGPLPPAPPLQLGGRRQALLERATLALGRPRQRRAAAARPANCSSTPTCGKEAVLSSQIEGTQSSLSDLLLFEVGRACRACRSTTCVEVSNYVAALEHGMARLREGLSAVQPAPPRDARSA